MKRATQLFRLKHIPRRSPLAPPRRAYTTHNATSETPTIIKSPPEVTSNPGESNVPPETMFAGVWDRLLKTVGGGTKMLFPKEIIFLMGAPGSGKGTNTPYILRARGITEPALVVSDLLSSPELKSIKDGAGLVSDELVCQLLLEHLLHPKYRNGVVVDGFPRTSIQVEIVRLLYASMLNLHKEFKDTVEYGREFLRPVFRVTVLYVDEHISIERQIMRGHEAISHNDQVARAGMGEQFPVRQSDIDKEAARQRYKIFQHHYGTLLSLQKHFHFNIINASGSIKEVEKAIENEFQFQAKMELDSETFDLVSQIKNSFEITRHARQVLVKRLDFYASWQKFLFEQVIRQLKSEVYPIIELNSLSGRCIVISTAVIWSNETATKMALDILAERGFRATMEIQTTHVPVKVDRETFRIITEVQTSYKFYLTWIRPRFLSSEYDGVTH